MNGEEREWQWQKLDLNPSAVIAETLSRVEPSFVPHFANQSEDLGKVAEVLIEAYRNRKKDGAFRER